MFSCFGFLSYHFGDSPRKKKVQRRKKKQQERRELSLEKGRQIDN